MKIQNSEISVEVPEKKDIPPAHLQKDDDIDSFGYNQAITEVESMNKTLEVDVEALVELIARYHFLLGLRIKSNAKEVVSPSRELAKYISSSLGACIKEKK